ncbi:MAG: primosomal protein N' [bacterium]
MSVSTSPRRSPTARAPAAACDVALALPVRSTFAYRVPPHLAERVRPGCRVVVPFGSRLLTGYVVGLDPEDAPEDLKSVRSLVDVEPLVDESLLELTRWIAERTLCSWGEALKAALPGHASPRRERVLTLGASTAGDLFGAAGGSLPDRILAAVGESGELPLRTLSRALGVPAKEIAEEVRRLVRAGRLKLDERVGGSAPGGAPRAKLVRLTPASAAPAGGASVSAADDALRRAPVQARCVELLREAGGELPFRDLAEAVAGSRAAVKRLAEKGLCEVRLEAFEGDERNVVTRVARPVLHAAQAAAVDAIGAALREGEPRVFLLHGVTGSGKTEVYLRAMEEARRLSRRSIFLVPEIALTPQSVTRLRGRFGGRAAVLHSRLADGERRRTWHLAREGRFDVVLGPRSAIFTPLPSLGLVVIDEEHEGAYKQEDAPRYHARDVAIERARRAGAVVVLGTATPDLETWARVERGEIVRLRLPERVASLPLPAVRLVDLRGQRGLFSAELHDAIAERLKRGEQTILFLNRRGFSPFVQCTTCGEAIRCSRCAVSLTYHRTDHRLRCHYCDHEEDMVVACPGCRARTLALRGSGTQRVEEELRARFPEARLARLDSDSVRRAGAHEEILGKFLEGEIDVLLGTQMVAKGLDFPRVTLVGVINADTGLHLPDYRSAERTFQLLAQVAGRAGRSTLGGEVIVQTRCPDHPCLVAARDHDDESFRHGELPQRRELRYPPYARLAGVLVRGESLPKVEAAAEAVRRRIEQTSRACAGWIALLGPAPAPLAQIRGKHRLRILVKGEREDEVRAAAARALEPLEGFPGVEIVVDVAPLDML